MKIEIRRSWGPDHCEVEFSDFEDAEILASSGLLNRDDAEEFAAQLRDVAHKLATWAQEDQQNDGQILLPIFGESAAA